MNGNPRETIKQSFYPDNIGKRLSHLERQGAFPRELKDVEENLIVNFCKENRWLINPASENIPKELISKNIITSTQSLGRIDSVISRLDQLITFGHSWSRMITYIDLVKVMANSVQIRLRYELTGSELIVKWIVIDSESPEDQVFVLIADNNTTVEQWEKIFLSMPVVKSKVSVKVFKYFLIDPEGSMINDYAYTELDDDRLEGDLDSKRFGFKIIENFLGLFVQDRFSLPLSGSDTKGILDFPQVMDLIKNELKTKTDKLAVLSQFNLQHEEIRVELETHVDKSDVTEISALHTISDTLQQAFASAEDARVLIRK